MVIKIRDIHPEEACQGRNQEKCERYLWTSLNIKFREFKVTSYISTLNLFKVSKREGFHNGTLSSRKLV